MDQGLRDLERRAAQGDPAAAERALVDLARTRGPAEEAARLVALLPRGARDDGYTSVMLTAAVYTKGLHGEAALAWIIEMLASARARADAIVAEERRREDRFVIDAAIFAGDEVIEHRSTMHSVAQRIDVEASAREGFCVDHAGARICAPHSLGGPCVFCGADTSRQWRA